MEAQVALVTFTVTVTPTLIVTASETEGTEAPPHVVVLFQLPDTEAVRCPKDCSVNKKQQNKKTVVNNLIAFKFVFIFVIFESYVFVSKE